METSKAVQWFKGHTGHVNCVTFSLMESRPLGKLGLYMRLWDVGQAKS